MSEIYHVLSRGVDKRKIFLDKGDYFRFIHNLFVLNNQKVVYTTHYNLEKFESQNKYVDIASPHIKREPRKLLANIHAFCLMPNHYHLLLSPSTENGIPKFMKKLNMAYAKYFNQKHKRKGTLF
ncbi:MAG TPA: transposase, partial [Candidatus Portnoybacteria bacterium]|nr:transposase [Candidatus Portnoybacteria bacterium]